MTNPEVIKFMNPRRTYRMRKVVDVVSDMWLAFIPGLTLVAVLVSSWDFNTMVVS